MTELFSKAIIQLCIPSRCFWGNFLAVHWLGLSAFTAMAQVQSLGKELSHKPEKGKKQTFWELWSNIITNNDQTSGDWGWSAIPIGMEWQPTVIW